MKRAWIGLLALMIGTGAVADEPAGFAVEIFGGDIEFAIGGMHPQYLTSSYLKTASVSGNTLTITLQGTDGNDGTDVTFTDHHIESASLSSAELLTVTLSDTTEVEIDLSALQNATEVSAAITSALADYLTAADIDTEIEDGALQPGDITGGTDIDVTTTADGITIDSTAADGVLTDLEFTGTTLTATLSVGGPVTVTGIGGSGGASADGVVNSFSFSGNTLSAARTESLSTLTIDIPFSTATDIDDRIADFALATGASGTIADARIPTTIARDSELPDVTGFLSESQVDGRIATYARISPSGQIADAQIPGDIARDSEIVGFLTQSEIDARITSNALQPGDVTGGTNVTVTVATDGITINASGGGGGGASLSDDTPADVAATGAAGTGSAASRDDHAHEGVTSIATSGTGLTHSASAGAVTLTHSHDGVVSDADYTTTDGDLVLTRSVGVTLTVNIDELIRPDSNGDLPDPEDRQDRVAVSGNQLLHSIDHGAVDKVVEFKAYGPDRVVESGEPALLTDEVDFQGSFASPPPLANYSVGDFLWDRGSSVWLIRRSGSTTWGTTGGPHGYAPGHLYATEDVAARHVTGTGYFHPGGVVIYGQGSAQRPYVIVGFTAGSAASWQWDPVGVTINEVDGAITARLSDDDPEDVATTASEGTGTATARATHVHELANGVVTTPKYDTQSLSGSKLQLETVSSTDANARVLLFDTADDQIGTGQIGTVNLLDGAVTSAKLASGAAGVVIAAYSSTATYSRGSNNSFVTDGGELYVYTSGSERSSNHNPGTNPQYWFRVSHGAEFINVGSGSHRYKAGTFLLVDNAIYLATTNITTARAAAYIIANAGDDQEFLLVNGGGSGGGGGVVEFDSADAYAIGDLTYTGTGDSTIVWVADRAIAASSTEPTKEHPQNWRIVAGTGTSRGLISDINVNVLRRGDIFWLEHSGGDQKVYFVRTSQNYTTEAELTDADDVIDLTAGGGGGGFTLHVGAGAPGSSLGEDGDWYLRTSNGQWYEKVSGAWVSRYTDMLGQAGSGLSAVTTTVALAGDGTSGDPLDIADDGVTTAKLADDAVTGAKIADDTIHGGALIDGTIATVKIGDSQVTGAKLSSSAVSTGKISDGAVTTVKLDNEAVTTAKIDDGAVTTAKLADSAVTQNKLAEFSVVTNKLANLQVTSAKLAADAAGEGKIPIDNTLQFDGSGDLGVQITTVTDLLDEDIRYYSLDTTREDAQQASKGVAFLNPSAFAKRIHSVEWDFEAEGIGHNYDSTFFELDSSGDVSLIYGRSATLFNLDGSGTHRFYFGGSDGLRIPGTSTRLGLVLSQTGTDSTAVLMVFRGQPADDSPRESYPDASNDFPFWRSVRFASNRPELGESMTYITNGEIYGYPKIRYTLELEHASLVGDGNITAAHIDSGSAANQTVLQADGSGGSAFLAVVVHGDNIVDNTIPTDKYGNETVTAGKMSSGSATDGHVATADGSGGVDYEAVEIGGVTHIESGATYNNNVITVSTTGTVRGGDGILFAVPTPFGTSATQEISLAIDGQADSEWPLHDRNGDALHEDDLTVNSVYIAISDADSWDILVLPDATGTGGSNDGVVNAGTYDAGTITLTRTESLADVTITDLPQVVGSVANPNATRIVTGVAWDSGAGGNESVTITDWRECDLLMPIFHDSSESAATDSNTARPNHAVDMFFTAELDADGSTYLGVSQNEGVRVLELSDTSDVLSFQWVGSSPSPSQNDTMDVWCLNAGGVNHPGDEEEDTTVGGGTVFDATTIDVPSGTWGFVNFGLAADLRLGEWHRFLVADLDGLTDGVDDGTPGNANSLTFFGNEESYFSLGKTSGGKVLVSASMGNFQPGTVRIRSN